MKIKILLDHVSRELNLALRVKEIFRVGNIGEVDIVHQDYINSVTDYDFFSATFSGDYDVIVTPNYNVKRTPEVLLRAIAANAKIVVYHSEQIFSEEFNKEKFSLDNLAEYERHISAHLVWGEYFANKLMHYAKVPNRKIFIVGNYKFDFLQDRSFVKNSKRKKVLLASDYKVGDLNDAEMKKALEMYKVTLPINFNRTVNQARSDALNWIECAALQYEDIDFCLRPHPGESAEPYERLSSLSNVSVSCMSKSYADDLKDSDVVFGFTSTSVLEIIYANKMFYSLKTSEFDLSFLADHKDLLTWIEYEDFMKVVAGLNQGQIYYPSEEQRNRLSDMICPYDDVSANVVLALKSVVSESFKGVSLSAKDWVRLARTFAIGSIKYLLIKVSNIFPGMYPFKRVIQYSKKSYENRIACAEIVSDSTLEEASSKAQILEHVIEPNLILTESGWKFEPK